MLKKIFGIIGLPVLAILVYFFYIKYNIEVPCIFHEITGLYCPGCGITRSIVSLLNLNIYQAFRYNPVSFILMPFVFIYLEYKFICYGFDLEDTFTKKIPSWLLYGIIIIYILFTILRNINIFDFLAPIVL